MDLDALEKRRISFDGRISLKETDELIAEIRDLRAKLAKCTDAMQTFVDRVENGEVRSTRTYAQFKRIIREVI